MSIETQALNQMQSLQKMEDVKMVLEAPTYYLGAAVLI
jgi:hypothetical protein